MYHLLNNENDFVFNQKEKQKSDIYNDKKKISDSGTPNP